MRGKNMESQHQRRTAACYERHRFRDDYWVRETNLDAFRETRPSVKSRRWYRRNFRLPNFILHSTSNFATTDPTVQALARTCRSAEREAAGTHPAIAFGALPWGHWNLGARKWEYLPAVRRLNL